MADPRYISMPWIRLQSTARDNVGGEYGRDEGRVADDRTVADNRPAPFANMGEVTVG